MTWRYSESSGEMRHNQKRAWTGYSGADRGRNNPSMQAAAGVGPIPLGHWRMVSIGDSPNTGPRTIVLAPEPGTDTHGRSAFRIHGDSIANPGHASHGCIILPRAARDAIWLSGDRDLEVTA